MGTPKIEILKVSVDKIGEQTYLSSVTLLVGETKLELKPDTAQSRAILEALMPFAHERLTAIVAGSVADAE